MSFFVNVRQPWRCIWSAQTASLRIHEAVCAGKRSSIIAQCARHIFTLATARPLRWSEPEVWRSHPHQWCPAWFDELQVVDRVAQVPAGGRGEPGCRTRRRPVKAPLCCTHHHKGAAKSGSAAAQPALPAVARSCSQFCVAELHLVVTQKLVLPYQADGHPATTDCRAHLSRWNAHRS